MEIVYDESTGTWGEREEPYTTLDVIFGYDSGYNRGCNNTWDSIADFFCNYGKDSKEK